MGMKPSTRPVSIEQVRSLLKKSARDLKDAATPGLSSERVFTIVQTETVGWFQKNMPQALPKR
jgi:hypothetical protein